MGKAQHGRSSGSKGFLSVPVIVGAAALVVGMAGAALIATHQPLTRTHARVKLTATRRAKPRPRSLPVGPMRVISIQPLAGAKAVSWSTPVTIHYSDPLAKTSALPTISPAVPGSWNRIGLHQLQFRPVGHFPPLSKETVTIPAGTMAPGGQRLGKTVSSTFTVKGASLLRLQELLAELGYLPVAFTPSGGGAPAASTSITTAPAPAFTKPPAAPGATGTTVLSAPQPATTTDLEPSTASDVPLVPLAGSFSWRFPNIPTSLSSLWQAGQPNVITTGAIMSFELSHGLTFDGVAGPIVWRALLKAAAAHQVNTAPYDYVYVSQGSPEFVTVWRDGVNVFTTLANTGIPQSPTAVGTWPVYLRYLTTTMSGTNPNGTHYSDSGIPWVSYFNGGDALHGFIRAQYGFPQSLGCVEMPFSSAKTVFPYTPIGTLVTIE
ncbi:MAG: L,D-transpeptidase family protein [Acidimicrobiales bacterium]